MKYPYIGRFLKPLFEYPIVCFPSWTYCIVEEDCGDNLHCTIPPQTLIHGNTIFNTGNFVIPAKDIELVELIECEGNEIGHNYSILIESIVPKLIKLQEEQWKKDVAELFKMSEQFANNR